MASTEPLRIPEHTPTTRRERCSSLGELASVIGFSSHFCFYFCFYFDFSYCFCQSISTEP
jgi:hypothetical protein